MICTMYTYMYNCTQTHDERLLNLKCSIRSRIKFEIRQRIVNWRDTMPTQLLDSRAHVCDCAGVCKSHRMQNYYANAWPNDVCACAISLRCVVGVAGFVTPRAVTCKAG